MNPKPNMRRISRDKKPQRYTPCKRPSIKPRDVEYEIDNRPMESPVPKSLDRYNSDPARKASGSFSTGVDANSGCLDREAYYAVVVGAIRQKLKANEAAYADAVCSRMTSTLRTVITRWCLKIPMMPAADRQRFVEGYVQEYFGLIACMESPYQLREAPWDKMDFTPKERETLESVILVRYLAGWWTEEDEMSYDQSGQRSYEMLVKYAQPPPAVPPPSVVGKSGPVAIRIPVVSSTGATNDLMREFLRSLDNGATSFRVSHNDLVPGGTVQVRYGHDGLR